jgi:uncharacterized membrane protein YphA (DoxX/SURF4 family)
MSPTITQTQSKSPVQWLRRHGHWLLTLYVAFVFIQSLFFKFTDSPETQYIFQGKLDPWAASLGFAGVFAPGGIFSAHVVGSFELIASVLLLAGALLRGRQPLVQVLGAAMGLGVISGAIFFHLFTPLGVAVVNTDGSSDGGELFMLACGVWLSCALLLWLRRTTILALVKRAG